MMATDVGRDEAAAVEALLPDLRVSNAIIGDASALSEAWRRDGYWFFRGVLDPDALATFRRPVLEELKKIGVVDDESELPLWNGRSMQRFPVATHAGYEPFPALVKSRRWREFLADPRIAEFFTKVIGSEVHWVPVAELRVNPPREVSSTGVFTYPHQDGFYNEGYRCLTAWMPLWPASRAAGGLAVAEGMHRGEYYHDLSAPPQSPFPRRQSQWIAGVPQIICPAMRSFSTENCRTADCVIPQSASFGFPSTCAASCPATRLQCSATWLSPRRTASPYARKTAASSACHSMIEAIAVGSAATRGAGCCCRKSHSVSARPGSHDHAGERQCSAAARTEILIEANCTSLIHSLSLHKAISMHGARTRSGRAACVGRRHNVKRYLIESVGRRPEPTEERVAETSSRAHFAARQRDP